MYLNVIPPGSPAALAIQSRGMGALAWKPVPMPFWPAPNPPAFVRSARGLRGLGIAVQQSCDPLDSACVSRNFEIWVQTMAENQTAQNRLLRRNCSADPFRTPQSCFDQYPDVSERDLAPNGLSPSNPIPVTQGWYEPAGYVADPNAQLVPNAPQTRSGGMAPNQGSPFASTTPPPPAGLARSVAVENLTRPGQTSAFQVGDSWRITVTGPANTAVSANSVHNGAPTGSASFGTTDSSGRAVLTGQMSGDTAGSWSESWLVGGTPAGTLTFSVAAAPGSSAPPPTGGGSGNPFAGGSLIPAGAGFDTSFLTKPVDVLGISIPVWGLGAAAVLALFVLGRGK